MFKDREELIRKAIRLRKSGQSYNEIRKSVPVVKSTLSLWLKDIPLSPEHRKRLYTKQIEILSRGPKSQKERRAKEVETIIKNAEEEITIPLSFETYLLMGAALYWGEGSKGKMFEITNSDPHLILFIVRWIEKIFNIPAKNLKARLNIYPQQSEEKIKKFWSDLLGIPLRSFGKSYVKPVSKGYKKNNLYYGTVRIEMPKSVDNRHRTFGWLRAVLREIDPKIQTTQKKWSSLAKVKRPVNL
jgi:hypothetical protein